jgi:hypothetical protein
LLQIEEIGRHVVDMPGWRQRLAKIDFVDDKAGKPVAINKFIGRRPIRG